jgi:small-conductance mechanosensitive channel
MLFNLPPWIPDWAVSVCLYAFAILVAVLFYRVAFRAATRLVRDRDLFWRSIVARNRRPVRLAFVTAAIALVTPVAPLTFVQAEAVRHVLVLCTIALLAWVALSALHVWTIVYLRRFKLDSSDNLLARKHATQTQILQRVGRIMVIAVAVGAGLMTFDSVRQYGISLLASAGAAGIIVGLALQPVLKNVFAGIQLAITQPIRIDDALLVEGEWGNVEEITATYVVVRIWDLRRLVIPLTYFIEKPFQNWTREDAHLIGSVFLHLDYRAPVEAIREKARAVVAASDLWDQRVFAVQVTELRQETMEIRILASAVNSGRTFDLRCLVREKMTEWLQREHPEALPRRRVEAEIARAKVPEAAA